MIDAVIAHGPLSTLEQGEPAFVGRLLGEAATSL